MTAECDFPIWSRLDRDRSTTKNPAYADTGLIHALLQTIHMRISERLQEGDQKEAIIREYEYDDTTTRTVDFGPEASDISVDVVDGTAVVVVNGEQFEFKLANDIDEIVTNNGILTITG